MQGSRDAIYIEACLLKTRERYVNKLQYEFHVKGYILTDVYNRGVDLEGQIKNSTFSRNKFNFLLKK